MQLLHTHFLFVQADDVPSNIQNLGKVKVPELYDITQAILTQLQNLARQPSMSQPLSATMVSSYVIQVQALLYHLAHHDPTGITGVLISP